MVKIECLKVVQVRKCNLDWKFREDFKKEVLLDLDNKS